MKKDNPIPQGHDRKFEKWTLKCPTDQGYANKTRTVEVFTHPANGRRGNPAVSFRAAYDGIGFEDTDIVRLRERLDEFHMGVKEDDWEKVLIIETSGNSPLRKQGDEFGIQWEIGWRIEKLGFVMDETRQYKREVENHVLDDDDWAKMGDFKVGTQDKFKSLVIPWTEEREAALESAAAQLKATRERVKDALRDENFFTAMLDTKGSKLLMPGENSA